MAARASATDWSGRRWSTASTATIPAVTWTSSNVPQFGRDALHIQYRSVLRKRRPIYLRNIYVMAGNVEAVTPRVLAPLSRDGQAIDMIISALVFEYGSALREAIALRDDVDATLGDAAVL